MTDVIDKADKLLEEYNYKELYEYLLNYKDSEDPEQLWRFARASSFRSIMTDLKKNEKKDIVFTGFDVAEKALKIDEENGNCHQWYGIMLKRKGEFLGLKHQIGNSSIMKKHFEIAGELNPSEPRNHYSIGMWHFRCADLSWVEKKVAETLFSKIPESSYQEALERFQKAESMSPSFLCSNQYMLGLTHLKMGDKAKAREWFEKATSYEVHNEEDKMDVQKAKDQLKSL